jgi:AraC family transcriptional regulator
MNEPEPVHDSKYSQDLVRGGLAAWQAIRVTMYIEANINSNVTVDDLAAVTGLSVSHFSRTFAKSFGCPPHRYLVWRRIEDAKRLMLDTSLSLGTIALECGLADQSHLNRAFLKFVGETPGVWRRARAIPPEIPRYRSVAGP